MRWCGRCRNMKCKNVLRWCRQCKRENVEKAETCAACGASTRCGNDAVQGYTRCNKHGGPNPAHNFYGRGIMTTGSGSGFPITRLAARYNKMMTDGQVLSNRAAINVIDERIKQLLEREDVGAAPDRLAKLYALGLAGAGFPLSAPLSMQPTPVYASTSGFPASRHHRQFRVAGVEMSRPAAFYPSNSVLFSISCFSDLKKALVLFA